MDLTFILVLFGAPVKLGVKLDFSATPALVSYG